MMSATISKVLPVETEGRIAGLAAGHFRRNISRLLWMLRRFKELEIMLKKEEIALRSCFGDWFTNIYQRKQIKIKYKYCIVEGQFSDGNLENVLLF